MLRVMIPCMNQLDNNTNGRLCRHQLAAIILTRSAIIGTIRREASQHDCAPFWSHPPRQPARYESLGVRSAKMIMLAAVRPLAVF